MLNDELIVRDKMNVEYILFSQSDEDLKNISDAQTMDKVWELGKILPRNFAFKYSPRYGQRCERVFKGVIIQEINFDSAVMYRDWRLRAAAVTRAGNEIILHPPATPQLAAARVAEQLKVPYRPGDTVEPLLLAMIAKHYPEALLAAGRKLTVDERRMSIAYVVDLEREADESDRSALERARPTLERYGLIIDELSQRSLEQYVKVGLTELRRTGLMPWEHRRPGRPPKKM